MNLALPLFHLYGDPPDDQAFDFIHIETISSRSSINDWTIRAHRHRNLFQILLIERGGGEMTHEAASLPFDAPAAILVAPTTAHGFRFRANETDGFVVSFTEDVADALGERSGAALARLKALAVAPVVPLTDERAVAKLSALCSDLNEEHFLAREGFRLAMRGLLALIAITVARLAASRARTGSVTLAWVAPASSPAMALATPTPQSLCVWMPMGALSLLRARAVMRAISPGRQPPFVSQSTMQLAPAVSAACHVASAYSGSFL